MQERELLPPVLLHLFRGIDVHARDEQVDSVRFANLVAAGRAHLHCGRALEAHRCLAQGLRLWGGPALAGLTDHQPLAAEIARLKDLRLSAAEYQATAALALGRPEEAVAELAGIVRECPLRERPRAHLMLALYRCGRQAEALALFRATREMLLDELGVEPGGELAGLQQAILRQDPALALPAQTV